MEEKVIQYISQDLYQEVTAQSFEEFLYNGENDSSFNDIKDVYSKLEDLKNSHGVLNSAIENLCTGVYSEKTEVCSELRNFSNLVSVHLNDIETTMNDMTEALKTVLEEQVVSDETLIDDLQKISELLGEDFDSSKYSSSSNGSVSGSVTTMPDGTTATTGTVEAQTAMAGPEPQEVKTVTPNPTPSEPASQPTSLGGAISGTLSPGTTANTFQAQAYNLSPDEYKAYCATIYAEAAEGNSYTVSDTMGVASAILNRVENGGWGGNTVTDVISASGQFSGYGFQNQKFAAAMNDPSIIPPEMRAAIDRTLAGERNTTGQSFSGNGTHNSFR